MAKPSRTYRDAYIKVMVAPSEKATFEKLAASQHITVSQLVRQLLHKESIFRGLAA